MDGFFVLLAVLYVIGFILGLILWIRLYTFLGNALVIYRRMDDNLKFIRSDLEKINERGG